MSITTGSGAALDLQYQQDLYNQILQEGFNVLQDRYQEALANSKKTTISSAQINKVLQNLSVNNSYFLSHGKNEVKLSEEVLKNALKKCGLMQREITDFINNAKLIFSTELTVHQSKKQPDSNKKQNKTTMNTKSSSANSAKSSAKPAKSKAKQAVSKISSGTKTVAKKVGHTPAAKNLAVVKKSVQNGSSKVATGAHAIKAVANKSKVIANVNSIKKSSATSGHQAMVSTLKKAKQPAVKSVHYAENYADITKYLDAIYNQCNVLMDHAKQLKQYMSKASKSTHSAGKKLKRAS